MWLYVRGTLLPGLVVLELLHSRPRLRTLELGVARWQPRGGGTRAPGDFSLSVSAYQAIFCNFSYC